MDALKRVAVAVKNKEDVNDQARLVFIHKPTAVLTDTARPPIKAVTK